MKIFFVVFILSFSTNSFAQNLEDDNYEIVVSDTNCRCGFYLSKNLDYQNPFDPSSKVIDFGVPDSSKIKLYFISERNNDTIVNMTSKLSKGCYRLSWFEQNLKKLKSGIYICSLEAEQKNNSIESYFRATRKLFFIK